MLFGTRIQRLVGSFIVKDKTNRLECLIRMYEGEGLFR